VDRKAAKRKEERNRYLAAIVQHSDDPMIGGDLSGLIASWNPAAERLFGYSEREVLGKPATILAVPGRAHEFQEIIEKVKKGLRVALHETQRRRKDGTTIDVSVTASPVMDEQGKLVGISVIDRDISSQKQSSQYARNLIEASLDPLLTISPEGKVTDVNEATVRVTGVPREELIGTDFSDYFTQPEEARAGYRLVFSKGTVTDYPLTIRHRDGRLTDVLYNASVYKDKAGNILGIFAAARDITAQKRATQHAQSLAAIVKSLQDAVISEDLDATITSWNPAAEKMFGYKEEEALGKTLSILAAPGRADEFKELIERVRKGVRVEHYETQRRRKDGTVVEVAVTVSPIRNEEGELTGLSVIDRDITAEKQASQYARSLIEASLDPLVTISPDGKITDVNEATTRVTGVAREGLIGTDFADYFTEPEKARKGYQLVFSRGAVTDYPLTIRSRGGKLADVMFNASVYSDVTGKVLGVFAAARDITAQKQAFQYARSLIEASLDPLVTISPDGKITDVNEATVKVTGVPRAELIGTDFSNYFTEPEKAREGYRLVFSEGTVTDYPLTIRNTDGRLTDVLYNASVYKDIAGAVLGVFAAARDITAQKRAEAQVAVQRARELERLAELEKFQRLTVGRELKMIELKKEIEALQKRLGESA
jgi:PAS domain S-box-containing protein